MTGQSLRETAAQTGNSPRLTDIPYWDRRSLRGVRKMRPSDYLEPYLGNILPVNSDWTCLEVGAVPGRLLLWMAQRFQYQVTGLDFSGQVQELAAAFRQYGVEATFVQSDFLSWEPDRKFHVVYSAGFVEHFPDYEEVIRKHWELVLPGGYLVLTIPAWSPVQRIIRRIVYTRAHYREIVASHNTWMMNLPALQSAVERCPGGRLVAAKYILEMKTWVRLKHRGVRIWTAPLFLPIRLAELFFRVTGVSHRSFSPSMLVVQQKLADSTTDRRAAFE